MKELQRLLEQIRAGAFNKAELLGIKRDIEWRLQCGLGKRKQVGKLALEVWRTVKGI